MWTIGPTHRTIQLGLTCSSTWSLGSGEITSRRPIASERRRRRLAIADLVLIAWSLYRKGRAEDPIDAARLVVERYGNQIRERPDATKFLLEIGLQEAISWLISPPADEDLDSS
jgi:hypothetical protein